MRTVRRKGRLLCGSCANKARVSSCGGCGTVALVVRRDPDGAAVCAPCLNRERQAETGRDLIAEIVEAVGVIDGIDHNGIVDSITATATTNRQLVSLLANLLQEPGLDIACRRRPNTIVFSDQLRARGAAIPAAGRPKPRPGVQHRCPGCGRPTRQANTTNCRACVAENNAARTSTCSNCGRSVRDATDGLCGHCHRWAQHRCATCDATTSLANGDDGAPRCHPCRLADDLDHLAGNDPADWVVELCEALRQAKSVASTRRWLASTSGGRLLARLVTGEVELTHEALDRRSDRSVERLRGLLIATGALAADGRRIEQLAEAVTTIADTIADDANRRVVASWLRWQALPRIRRRAETGKPILHSAQNLRRQTRTICRFIEGLDGTLAECRQVDIDNWFAAPGTTAALVTAFLNWAATRGHLRAGLDIPTTSRSREPTTPIDHQRRWAIARRLVDDDTIHPDDRVAGALVVLYAQPLTRIARLRVDQLIHNQDGEITIAFDTHQIDLTEPFAGLARRLPLRRRQGAADQLETRWLFPSNRPDQPVHPTTIADRLRRIGIDPQANRATALTQLATEIPPALLAQSIGIGARQASRWVGLSGGNWTTYRT